MVDFKLINSVHCDLTPNILAFCSFPFPSFVVLQQSNKAISYTINGTPIKIFSDTDEKIITSFCTFRNFTSKEYIVIGYNNGNIEIRKLPSLKIHVSYENERSKQEKVNLKVAVSPDAQFILASTNGDLYMLLNIDTVNANLSNNLGNLGF